MKEMNPTYANYLGGSVKKTLFVVALATMLVFAVVGSAFAVAQKSGQQRFGRSATAPANVVNLAPGQTNPVAGAGTFTYLDWNTSLGTNSALSAGKTPHGNYTTTTVKCVVCHAVHYAAPGTAPGGSTLSQADTLLRMKASDSCVYCHASATGSVNGRPVYNGLGAAIIGDGTEGHVTGTNCSFCHTGVHGAGQDNSVASLAGYLLITLPNTMGVATGPGGTYTTYADSSPNMLAAIGLIDQGAVNQGFASGAALNGTPYDYQTDPSSTMREQAVGIFCAECHNGAYATAAAGATTNVTSSSSAMYSGHRIAAAATSDWNGVADKVSSSPLSGIPVAWAAADNCKSCHDAVDNFNNAAFPHAWGSFSGPTPTAANAGSKMWLLSAATEGVAKSQIQPVNGTTNSFDTTKLQLSDGVCLKCHVASGGGAGVGITF